MNAREAQAWIEQKTAQDVDAVGNEIKMTSYGAIQHVIFEYQREIRDRKSAPDPERVVPCLESLVFYLKQAQRDLEELRELKRALAALKSSVI